MPDHERCGGTAWALARTTTASYTDHADSTTSLHSLRRRDQNAGRYLLERPCDRACRAERPVIGGREAEPPSDRLCATTCGMPERSFAGGQGHVARLYHRK